jgi:hypothetical protein
MEAPDSVARVAAPYVRFWHKAGSLSGLMAGPLLGVSRTWRGLGTWSANDPKQKWTKQSPCPDSSELAPIRYKLRKHALREGIVIASRERKGVVQGVAELRVELLLQLAPGPCEARFYGLSWDL